MSTEHFDGPLDLLLQLVRKRELPLSKVSLVKVAADFQQMIEERTLDADAAGEALVVAATLVEMKSNALLPRPASMDLPEEASGDRLVAQLLDYARFRKAAEVLETLADEAGQSHVVRADSADSAKAEVTLDLDDLTPTLLHEVYVRATSDLDQRGPLRHEVEDDPVPFEELKRETLARLSGAPTTLASLLTGESISVGIGRLLAVLELLRDGLIRLESPHAWTLATT